MAALRPATLCYLCEAYDFDEFFNTPVRDCDEEHLVEDLPQHSLRFGSLDALQSRSEYCQVCAFLTEAWFQARLPSRPIRQDDQLILRRWRGRHGILGWADVMGVSLRDMTAGCARFEIADAGWNGITIAFDPQPRSRFKSMARFRTFAPDELHGLRVDLTLVKSWTDMCERRHPRCQAILSKKSDLSELKLINVYSREIIPANSQHRYAALSYVWSQAGYPDGIEKPQCVKRDGRLHLPEVIPQVVQDALHIVKNIGLKYLWVDSFCIDQRNVEEKKRLIGKMDLVFEGASTTICAVSERDDPPGICGVSIPMQRKAQIVHECTVGTFKTVEIPQFTREISRSLWSTRAWTMEEALLSPRCILFMKNQTALWCKSHVFHDSFSWSEVPASVSSPTGSGVHSSPVFTADVPEAPHWDFEAWSRILTEYTGRSLTEERDAMRALAGLRNRVSRNTSTPLPFGLPLSISVCSLLWKIRDGASCTRRNGFPSWSWLGWHATVEFDHWLEFCPVSHDEATYELGIPKKSYSLWGRREFGRDPVYLRSEARVLSTLGEDLEPYAHQTLRLECQSAHFQVRRVETNNGWQLLDRAGEAVPAIKGYSRTDSYSYLILPEKKYDFDPKRLEFLCIQHWKEAKPLDQKFGDVVTTIAITREASGKATRIGAFAIPYVNWKAAEPQLTVIDII